MLGLDVGLLAGLFPCCPSQNGLVPVASLGVENQAFETEQVSELDEGASQSDSEVKVQVDWTSELPVSVSVPTVNIHSLVLDFSAVSFLDVVAAKSLKLVCLLLYLYCSLRSHCLFAIMHIHNMKVTFMSFQTCMTFSLPQNTKDDILKKKKIVYSMKVNGVRCCFEPH